MEYFSDTFKALQLLQSLGFDLFVVTNQSGVGRGYFALENVYVIHKQLQNDMRANKLQPFKDFAICPHSPEDKCNCRKPAGTMITELVAKFHLTLEGSYMVGDKLIDAECGKNAGVQGILIRQSSATSKDFPTFKNLLEFAQSLKK